MWVSSFFSASYWKIRGVYLYCIHLIWFQPHFFSFYALRVIVRTSEPLHDAQILNQMVTSNSNPGSNSACISKNQVIMTAVVAWKLGRVLNGVTRHLVSLTLSPRTDLHVSRLCCGAFLGLPTSSIKWKITPSLTVTSALVWPGDTAARPPVFACSLPAASVLCSAGLPSLAQGSLA